MGTAYVSSQTAKVKKVSQSKNLFEEKRQTSKRGLLIDQVPFDVSTLHQSEAMAAQHGMVDLGDGHKQVQLRSISSHQSVCEEQLRLRERLLSICRCGALKAFRKCPSSHLSSVSSLVGTVTSSSMNIIMTTDEVT